MRHRNFGLIKRCRCKRTDWPRCSHGWHFSFKTKGGPRWRLSLDVELGRHVESKTEAYAEADRMRTAIRNGTFRKPSEPACPVPSVTIEQLGESYFSTYTNPKTGEPLSRNERSRWDLVMGIEIERPGRARVRFGALPLQEITRHDIEAFRAAHLERRIVTITDSKGRRYQVRRGGAVGVHRCLGRLRAFFGWAVDKDHIAATPFKKGGTAIKGLFAHEGERARRLEPGEEERLFKASNPHLQAVLTAALETGCRIGELLSLQWRQVRFDLNEIHLRAVNTKARRARHLPMSHRLRAVIEMRRHDQNGREYPGTAFVFGDETGARIKSVKTAWENARLKAHGYEVKRERNARLSAECRRQLADINLHFHDLRREAGSRLLDAGVPLGVIQAFLDHANISTSSRYLKVTQHGLHVALKHYEEVRRRDTNVTHATNPLPSPDRTVVGKSLQ